MVRPDYSKIHWRNREKLCPGFSERTYRMRYQTGTFCAVPHLHGIEGDKKRYPGRLTIEVVFAGGRANLS
jgi:hypothetical protein